MLVFVAILAWLGFQYYQSGKGFNGGDDEVNKVRSKLQLIMATEEKPSSFYEHAIFILGTIVDDQNMTTEEKEDIARSLGELADAKNVSSKTLEDLMEKIKLDAVTVEKVTVNRAIGNLVKDSILNDDETKKLLSGINNEGAKLFAQNKLAYLANLQARLDEPLPEMTAEDKTELKKRQQVAISWDKLMGMPDKITKRFRDNKDVFKYEDGKKGGRRFLFYSRPGTGKSEVAQAIQANSPDSIMFELTASGLGSLENQAEAVIADKFRTAHQYSVYSKKPAIIKVDEADSIFVGKSGNAIAFQLAMDKYPDVNVIFITNNLKSMQKSARAVVDRVDSMNIVSFDGVDTGNVKKLTLQARIAEIGLQGTTEEFTKAIDKIAKDETLGIRSALEMAKTLERMAEDEGRKLNSEDLVDYLKEARKNSREIAKYKDMVEQR